MTNDQIHEQGLAFAVEHATWRLACALDWLMLAREEGITPHTMGLAEGAAMNLLFCLHDSGAEVRDIQRALRAGGFRS